MRLASPAVPPAGSAGTTGGLTAREREVLALIARGLSNQEIARELMLSVRTVERHISNIYDKIGAAGRSARAAAATYAAGVGLRYAAAWVATYVCGWVLGPMRGAGPRT